MSGAGALPLPVEIGCYLAGFVDGEGCFYIQGPARKGGYLVGFAVKLRADDRPLLEWLCEQTGFGTVKACSGREGRRWGNQEPQARWDVTRKAEVVAFRDIFDTFQLQSKKRRDFEIWSRAVDAWMCIQGRGNDWSAIAAAKAELQAGRVFREAVAA